MTPLRAIKIAAYAGLAGALIAGAEPRLRVLLQVACGPYSEVDQLPHAVVWPGVAIVAAAALVVIVREAVAGHRAPRILLAALVPLGIPAAVAGPQRPPGNVSALLLAAAQAEIQSEGLPRVAGPAEVSARRLPRTAFRDRLGRRLPARMRVLPGRAGPVLEPQAGDAPGTLYLALAPGERVGWLTGLCVAPDGEPALIHRDGAPLILRVGREEVP